MDLKPEQFFSQLPSMSEDELLAFIDSSHNFNSADIQNFLDYILERISPLDLKMEVFDCCGTGGDKANTFNISTAAAIVAAATGVKVCKNGGRSTTSTTGSVDVLEALGLNLAASLEAKINGLQQFNLAFYSSPVSAELLATIKQICRKHKRTSFLSLLGPLASPVKLYGQVIGCAKAEWLNTLSELQEKLLQQGSRHNALIIHSEFFDDESGLDELSVCSKSKIIELNATHQQTFDFDPRDLGLELRPRNELEGGSNHHINALIIKESLNANSLPNAAVETIALNAAAILYLANKEPSRNYNEFLGNFNKYYKVSLNTITSGKALENFYALIGLYSEL